RLARLGEESAALRLAATRTAAAAATAGGEQRRRGCGPSRRRQRPPAAQLSIDRPGPVVSFHANPSPLWLRICPILFRRMRLGTERGARGRDRTGGARVEAEVSPLRGRRVGVRMGPISRTTRGEA